MIGARIAGSERLSHGSLCTGYGGLDMAAQAVFGGDLAWWSDVDPGPIAAMKHHHPGVTNVGDLKVADWSALPAIDILTAGYPCQPFSNAGKRLGTDDPRHLWPWIAQAIGVLRPRVVVLENVAAHLRKGFDVVSADLAALGYHVAWTTLRASDVGAAHRRDRLFIVAADAERGVLRQQPRGGSGPSRQGEAVPGGDREDAPYPDGSGLEGSQPAGRLDMPAGSSTAVDWQEFEPAIRRWEGVLGRSAPAPSVLGPRGGVKVSPGFGEWLMGLPEGHITDVPDLSINEQLKLVGNGVVPQQAEHAIRWLLGQLALQEAA